MEFLGIGPLELILILIVALVVLGPKDMVKAGRTIGRTLRTIVSSDTWRVVQQTSREMRNLPNRLMREAGIEDLQKQMPTSSQLSAQMGLDELNKGVTLDLNKGISPWTTPPPSIAPPPPKSAGEMPEGGVEPVQNPAENGSSATQDSSASPDNPPT